MIFNCNEFKPQPSPEYLKSGHYQKLFNRWTHLCDRINILTKRWQGYWYGKDFIDNLEKFEKNIKLLFKERDECENMIMQELPAN